ncbi:NTP transferase domain-containing protein [Bradyrhizobium lablabi]|uniref:sugar phosphate nucleotidyltransferase n=1 Tax=Bradyrhizobium lablabi TaxID=722472 RepID=UPI001BA9FEBE|nr:sugar phosphate nucleotidyltransferase [Bradyrhizobium lablabi]MBR1123214.1 NTP transferase domain-containing protein [Bradyrhizobium lablabi]
MNELSFPGSRSANSLAYPICEPPPVIVRQAVVMAGGKGTRLHPYSALFPKPLMPLGDMPILELLLRRMRAAGVREVIIAVNHLRHLIEVYFGDGSDLGLKLYYSDEDKPLGTAGALGNMLPHLDDTFFVTNGDLLTTMNLRDMALRHLAENADASVGVYERENKIDFGLIEFDARNRMCAYREKPTSKYHVSMGVYILQREAVRPHVSNVDYLDMPNLLLKIKGGNGNVVCYQDNCIWLDIGRPDDFALAQKMFEEDREAFLGHA